jgi:hypothetical protein
VPVGNAAVNPSLFPDLPYDMKQFAPITQIANVENVLVVSAKSPVKTVAELIALGAQGRNITYATPGAGSIAHLAAELFARTRALPVTQISLSRRCAGADRRAARRVTMIVRAALDRQAADRERRAARARHRHAALQRGAAERADHRRSRQHAGLRGVSRGTP